MLDESKKRHFKTQLQTADSKTVSKIVNGLLNNSKKILPDHEFTKNLCDDFFVFFCDKVSNIHTKLQTQQCIIDNCIDESIENSVLCTISEFRFLMLL